MWNPCLAIQYESSVWPYRSYNVLQVLKFSQDFIFAGLILFIYTQEEIYIIWWLL